MPRLLNLLTAENLAYAERARTLRSVALQYQPHTIFEVMEPGLRVRATYLPAYRDNLFLCEHPDEAGWSILKVEPPVDYRGVAQSLSYLATEQRRDLLFEAWLERPKILLPLTTLFENVAEEITGERFRPYSMAEECIPTLLLLRAAGPGGDALRALYALGGWPEVTAFADRYDLLRVEVEGLSTLAAADSSKSQV